MGLFGRRKNPGACFWGRKKPLREWRHAIPRFSIKTTYFRHRNTQGRVFGGGKNPCGKHADSHSGFGWESDPQSITPSKCPCCAVAVRLFTKSRVAGQVYPAAVLRGNPHHQSSPGFEPGASGVRRPCANPLGNLTTVGHLAKVSPDRRLHFQTQKQRFLTSFQRRKNQFSDT